METIEAVAAVVLDGVEVGGVEVDDEGVGALDAAAGAAFVVAPVVLALVEEVETVAAFLLKRVDGLIFGVGGGGRREARIAAAAIVVEAAQPVIVVVEDANDARAAAKLAVDLFEPVREAQAGVAERAVGVEDEVEQAGALQGIGDHDVVGQRVEDGGAVD